MGLGICDRRFWTFILSCKLCGRCSLRVGYTLIKFETSIIAGQSSGFGVKPKSNVFCRCCQWVSQRDHKVRLTRSRSSSICTLILYFEFKTDRRAMGQNFGIPLVPVSADLKRQKEAYMNAHPDGLRGKASLRIANAKALTISSGLCTSGPSLTR